MAEVYILSSASHLESIATKLSHISHESQQHFISFKSFIEFLFTKGNDEKDKNHATLIVLETTKTDGNHSQTLDNLGSSDKRLLLKYFFAHLNLIIVSTDAFLTNSVDYQQINKTIDSISVSVGERISRVETWTGTGNLSTNDIWTSTPQDDEIIPTMSYILSSNTSKSTFSTQRLIELNKLINAEVDFVSLLLNHSQKHLAKLCAYVGLWSFPAHELSNDDLAYCVYLMIKYSMDLLPKDCELIKLNNNELLGFVFMVRDSYNNGNPFHNFRHATDVLQACFHFLIRLDCLPIPYQMEIDPNIEDISLKNVNIIVLISTQKHISDINDQLQSQSQQSQQHSRRGSCINIGHLNPIETFGLLIAALGHDVGHPGVTNAFMTKYSSPTSLVYNGRSVLELFHSSIFINKLLLVNWPSLLSVCMDTNSQLSMRELIISCILATDMAEHFEYIGKICMFKDNIKASPESKVKLISSLLIKCADISNVTRPLRVSSQWAFVLSREFEEVSTLEKKINSDKTGNDDIVLEPKYKRIPSNLRDILQLQPDIYKGQIFFINTFAENLFKSVAEILPELQFTCDIALANKSFWFECKDKDVWQMKHKTTIHRKEKRKRKEKDP